MGRGFWLHPTQSYRPGLLSEGQSGGRTEAPQAMTKWVTLLLIVLALLAYGLSQMRPVPPQEAGPSATPAVVVESPAPVTAGEEPTPVAFRGKPVKGPKFGLGLGAATPSPGQGTANSGRKPGKDSPTPVAGKIKAITFSATSDGGALTKFRANSESIYAVATPEGLKDSVEVVASYRSTMNDKAEFSPPVDSSGPPRRRLFRLAPPEGGWQEGPYQVVFKVKGSEQVVGMDRFEITSPEAELVPQPKPDYLELVTDIESEAKNVFEAEEDKILLRVPSGELQPGTVIRTVWSAVEVDRLTAGELIAVTGQPAPGPELDAIFTFEAPPSGFHSGSYKVDVYFDQELAGSQAFFIQAPVTQSGSR